MGLEKILEEIRIDRADINTPPGGDADKIIRMCYKRVEKIIRKHMNDGWISCEERLPTKEEYLKDDGRFILDDGNKRYQGLFDIYDGKFKFSKHISGINDELFEDECVIAWRPLPEPYRPEKGATDEECM